MSSGTPGSTSASDLLHTDNEVSSQDSERDRKHDVFISYRRQTGKHLAGSVKSVFCHSISKHISLGSVWVGHGLAPVIRTRLAVVAAHCSLVVRCLISGCCCGRCHWSNAA